MKGLTKELTLVLGLVAFSLASASAQAVPFMSSLDDHCVGCTLSDQIDPYYVDPTGTALDGAAWIQDTSSWHVNDSNFRVWEEDLNKTGTDLIIDSLFVSYDDNLIIKSQGDVLFDSNDHAIDMPWTKVINVFDYVAPNFLIAGNGRLNFWVTNDAHYATGVIWKGNATASVPEPGTLALLGLGLVGLGFSRRKAKAA